MLIRFCTADFSKNGLIQHINTEPLIQNSFSEEWHLNNKSIFVKHFLSLFSYSMFLLIKNTAALKIYLLFPYKNRYLG